MFGVCSSCKRASIASIYSRRFSVQRVKFAQTHYEVLGLKESCTHEEIKEAFYKKMKLLHPDKNAQNSTNHKLAVAVNEAYSILGRKYSREIYDQHLSMLRAQSYHNSLESDIPYDRVIFRDNYNFYQETIQRDDKNYYEDFGIKGVKRLPNGYIATGVVIFMIFGVILHIFLASISTRYVIKRLDEKDERLGKIYKSVKEDAERNGKEKQIELLYLRFQEQEAGKIREKLSTSDE